MRCNYRVRSHYKRNSNEGPVGKHPVSLSREFQNKCGALVSLDLLEILVTIKMVVIRLIEKPQR